MKSRRIFSREFKLEVLQELESGKRIVEICRQNNISKATLYNQKFSLIYDEWKFFFDGHCCPVQKSDQALSMQDKKPPIFDGWFFMWKKEHRLDPGNAFSGNGKISKLDAKLAERERLIGELYAENSLLKKAVSRLGERITEFQKKSD